MFQLGAVLLFFFLRVSLGQDGAGHGMEKDGCRLLGHWPLDETNGVKARDCSEWRRDGELKNVTWAGNADGSAPEFNGLNGYIKIPHDSRLNLRESFTIEAWVFLGRLKGMQSFVSKGRGEWGSGYTFFQENGKLFLGLNTTEKPGENIKEYGFRLGSDPILKEKTWSFVAVSYDYQARRVRFYRDGKLVAEKPAGGRIVYLPPSDYDYVNVPLTLSGIATYPTVSGQLSGFLREVRIYEGALCPSWIESDYEKTAWVRDIKLKTQKEVMAEKSTCALHLSVFARDTGRPLPARVYVKMRKGAYLLPEDYFSYGTDKKGYFYMSRGGAKVQLPPAEFEVSIVHGFEYEPARTNLVFCGENESQEWKVELERWVDFPKKGWFGGEHHIQYIGHGTQKYDTLLGFLNASRLCEAEGMNYASFVQGIEVDATSVCSQHFIAKGNLELCPSLGGHLCCVNIERAPQYDHYHFENMRMIDDVLSQGGLAVYTHPSSGMGDLGDGTCSREMPVAVALGKMPLWDVSYGALRSFDHVLVKDWYRYLNLGFKLAAGGSTDVYLNNPIMGPAGASRTYVKIERLGWPEIVQAYQNGRTFITNGPLLVFQVNGKDIGETVMLAGQSGEMVRGHLEAYSLNGLEKIEIVKNGKIVETFPCNRQKKFEKDFFIEIDETCWLAMRCHGLKGDFTGHLAHSSPIYIRYGGKKMKTNSADAEYFIQWLEEYKGLIPKYCEYRKEKAEDAGRLIKEIDRAMEKYKMLK